MKKRRTEERRDPPRWKQVAREGGTSAVEGTVRTASTEVVSWKSSAALLPPAAPVRDSGTGQGSPFVTIACNEILISILGVKCQTLQAEIDMLVIFCFTFSHFTRHAATPMVL